MKLGIYTATFGAYDTPKSYPAGDYDVVVYTDDRSLQVSGATVRWADFGWLPPVRKARFVKALSHIWMSAYEATLWLDASMTIRDPAAMMFDVYRLKEQIAAPLHRERNCIYQEAKICASLGIEKPFVADAVARRYREENYPEGAGLHETGTLFRVNCPEVHRFNRLWWALIENGSHRDQLSFDFAAWKLKVPIGNLPAVDQNAWISQEKHLIPR